MQINRFSIKEVEALTGVKQHTIRIWEQRYNVPQPKRTATNIRYYTDNDLKLLLNIAMLNRIGHKISKIACLNECEIEKLVLEHIEKSNSTLLQLESLINAVMRMDEKGLEKIIQRNILKEGFELTMTNLIFPFLHRVGMMWQAGCVCPAYEHFLASLIRQKIIAASDGLKTEANHSTKKFMLFLPQGESHELGLLYANYLIRSRGQQSVYLGQNLPFDCLQTAFNTFHPNYIVSVITSPTKLKDVQNFIQRLASSYPHTQIILSGTQLLSKSLHIPHNVSVIEDFDRFTNLIESER